MSHIQHFIFKFITEYYNRRTFSNHRFGQLNASSQKLIRTKEINLTQCIRALGVPSWRPKHAYRGYMKTHVRMWWPKH